MDLREQRKVSTALERAAEDTRLDEVRGDDAAVAVEPEVEDWVSVVYLTYS